MTTSLEINVVSVEGLHKYSYCYFTPIRPFITLTKLPTDVGYPYDEGGALDHMFRVSLDPTFFSDSYSSLYLQLYKKSAIVGPTQLGWCVIPASEIGLLPHDSVRYLSYRLRAKDGTRSHVIINLSVTVRLPPLNTCQTVVGIPVTAVRGAFSGGCSGSTKRRRLSEMETEL